MIEIIVCIMFGFVFLGFMMLWVVREDIYRVLSFAIISGVFFSLALILFYLKLKML